MCAQSDGWEKPRAASGLLFLSPTHMRGALMTEHDTPLSHPCAEDDVDVQLARYRVKLEEVAELVARIRHEINNPLTGILGQAQLLLREDLNDRARKRAQSIEELALRLRDVAAQLREVQRPATAESNEADPVNKPFA